MKRLLLAIAPSRWIAPGLPAKHLQQQIAHWGEVVSDHKIEAPTN
jgi:hypothetical protein